MNALVYKKDQGMINKYLLFTGFWCMLAKVVSMARAMILTLMLMLFLGLNTNMECQVLPRPPKRLHPLCISQFALVNHACSLLPYNPGPPPSPPSPPTPPPPDDDGHGRGHGNRHKRGHGHRHRHSETPIEEDCCRWLKEVDSECVCDMLVSLPPFLSKPLHQYTVIVDDSCNVTFNCGGRLF